MGLRVALALPGIHHVRRGAETAMEALAEELAKRSGVDVTVFGGGDAVPGRAYAYERIETAGLGAFSGRKSLPLFRTPAQWEEFGWARRLLRQAGERRWDVTIACSWPWVHFALRRLGGRHVFWTQNGDHMIAAGRAEYRLFSCDGLVCTNPDYFDRHRGRWRSVLVPNGVDPDVFCLGENVLHGRDARDTGCPRRALVVSALIPSKRVDAAVRAVAAVGGCELVMCGSGTEEGKVDALGRELLGERYRRVVVAREEMPGMYRSADVVVHPSEVEPSANVWSEAVSSGVPVVAHDMAVTRWVIGEQGVLVDARDDAALADGVRRALALPRELAAARHAWAVERLAWSSIGGTIAEFAADVTGRTAARALAPTGMGAVIIGRNEGERLLRCFRSLPAGMPVVYVDSGSLDGSVARAKGAGAEVVELDRSKPFTAARGRNAGLAALAIRHPEVKRVVFLDGDTELLAGFLRAAAGAMDADPVLVGVAGRRRERFPEATIYNRLCEMEWDVVPGEVTRLGGDAVYSVDALAAVGGFHEGLIAGEEPELGLRLRRKGGRLARIPADMTLHDAAMTRFGQWWKRNVRAGHAFAEGHHLYGGEAERYRRREVVGILMWAVVLPAAVLVGGLVWTPLLLGVPAWPVQAGRVAWSRMTRGAGVFDAGLYGMMTMLGKFAQLSGVIGFQASRFTGAPVELIEYKSASTTGRKVQRA